MLDHEGRQISQEIKTSMFLAFVDFENQDPKVVKESQLAVKVMEEVEQKFGKYYGFWYCNNSQWESQKHVFGITWPELPAMAFNMMDKTVLPYPRFKKIDTSEILAWFERTVVNPSDAQLEKLKSKSDHISVVDKEIYKKFLYHTVHTTRQNFSEVVLSEGTDVFALLYSTQKVSQDQRTKVSFFNELSWFVHSHPAMMTKIRLVSYDHNANGFPSFLEYNPSLPLIHFFPAYQKQGPFRRYTGELATKDLMKFILEQSEILAQKEKEYVMREFEEVGPVKDEL